MAGLPENAARPILATDRARFAGEPIVAIVATSASAAADAAELVEIGYEPLPPVIDPATAAANDSILFPDVGSNEVVTATGPGENEAIDFSGFEVVVEGTFLNQRLAPCPLETRVAASMWTEDGRLLHYAACQGAHPIQKGLAAYYGLDESDVRVVTQDVGGSFGAKSRLYPEDLLLPELARRTGRPVRWLPTRSDDMAGLGHSRAQIQRVTVGGDRDGTIRALSAHLTADLGAYPVTAGGLARNTGMILPRPLQDRPGLLGAVGRGHQHHPAGGLPGRRATRSRRPPRSGRRPVRGRDRHGPPGRPSPQHPPGRGDAVDQPHRPHL